MNQKDTFLAGEGDAWFQRNCEKTAKADAASDMILSAIKYAELPPVSRVLEIGCADGSRLEILKNNFAGAECFGVDPSEKAVKAGNEKYGHNLQVGTADSLPYEKDFFNLVLFGFSLYLCDRKDLFKIACEADRCLCNGGYLIIKDFYPPLPYRNTYVHCDGISSYKMDYSRMFTWNPAYTEIFRILSSHQGYAQRDIPDERIGVTILHKNYVYAYPHDIQWI